MAFLFIVLAAFVAATNAGHLGGHLSYGATYAAAPQLAYAAAPQLAYAAPVAQAVVTKTVDEYDPHPQYSYAYNVQDGLTGDSKSQHESRNGDVVEGSYSLLESDGTRRTVDYTADDVNGFNAVVRKEPAHVAIKTVHAAPIVHHSAPVVQAHYAAPAVIKTVAPAQATISQYSTSVDYSAPVAHTVAEYSAPAVQYSAPSYVSSAYALPAYSAPAAAGW